jgi:hypothetical protein
MRRGAQLPSWVRASAGTTLLAFVVLLVVISMVAPFLAAWRGGSAWDWNHLADVGQAYGGVSAVLTGLGFCGIAISLLMQRRQNRLTLLYSIRDRQFDLVKLALDNPQFLFTENPTLPSDPTASLKVYANLQVGHWALLWDLGILKPPALQLLARRLFATPFARDWWNAWGTSYLDYRPRRFFDIVDRECQAAVNMTASQEGRTTTAMAGPPTTRMNPAPTVGRRRSQTPATTKVERHVLAGTVAGGIAAGLLLGEIGRYLLRRQADGP